MGVMDERFVGEAIRPVAGSIDSRGMAEGGPGLPRRFVWRGEEYFVDEVLGQWKQTAGCTHGSDERYVRKHWFHIRTSTGEEMKIYCDRQARSKRERKARWWLYTVAGCGRGKA